MDLQGGLTPIDTLYEWTGFVLAERFADTLLWNRLFVGVLAAAALLRLLYVAQKKASYFDLAAYPVYLAFMAFLVSPVTVTLRPQDTVYRELWNEVDASRLASPGDSRASGGRESGSGFFQVRVPRLLAVTHRIADGLIRTLSTGLGSDVGYTLFRWQAVAAGFKQASILDPELSTRFHAFLRYCFWPARAVRGLESPDLSGGSHAMARGSVIELPLREGDPGIYAGFAVSLGAEDAPCTSEREVLLRDLQAHISSHPVHAGILRTATEASPRTGAEAAGASYLSRILYQETYASGSRGEMALLREAVPAYSSWDPRFLGTAKVGTLAQGVSGVLGLVASFWEGASQETLGPTLYYRLTLFAPYLYGLLQAVLLLSFPIAGLWSLWPGAWTAILNFLKLWLSIKIWPLFWSFLSAFNIYRLELPPDDPLGMEGSGGSSAMFASVAAMYVLVPVLSYLVMNLVTKAGMIGISSFTGSGTGAGPAAGSIVTGVSGAGRLGAAAGGLTGGSRGHS